MDPTLPRLRAGAEKGRPNAGAGLPLRLEVGMMIDEHCPFWSRCLDIARCLECWAAGKPRQPGETPDPQRGFGLTAALMLLIAILLWMATLKENGWCLW